MPDKSSAFQKKHEAFLASPRRHILMITNHGIQQWRIFPGLPDTGGQVVFVNNFSDALTKFGFKITIANRGGYPHPITGERREGIDYKDAHQRIVYLVDGLHDFVRKEDMHERMPALVEALKRFIDAEGTEIDLIVSHYWDGAQLGVLYNRTRRERVKHVWVPHSLGAIKKRNVPPDRWRGLRIDERIAAERGLIADLDGIGATSSRIKRSLDEDYGYTGPVLFLPPSVNPERYHPREIADDDEVWSFLSQWSELSPETMRECKIVTEISRTVTTKRKDVLIEAFAAIQQQVPNSLLVVSVDDSKVELAGELRALIRARGLRNCVATYVPDEVLPALYAVTDVYCTPSVMEGFGMSAQEAAASGVPVVSSSMVPFVVEYLLGEDAQRLLDASVGRVANPSTSVKGSKTAPSSVKGSKAAPSSRKGSKAAPIVGEGAVVVRADDVDGFARALEMLLTGDELREKMGANAYRITIPYFTWPSMVAAFLERVGVRPGTADADIRL